MAWLLRLLGGFNIFNSSKSGERIGKIIFYAVIALIVSLIVWMVIWKVFLQKQVTTHINNTGTIIYKNDCPQQPAFSLLKLWKLNLLSVQ